MGKIVKLTEEELHKIIREKIQEALEHNVDLDYSPAIGNKKRGPGKETLDQMKKRKNTKLDESLDETFDERDDDIEFFEDEENYKNRETEIDLTEEDYEYAFEQMFGKADNVVELIEKYNLPDWTKIEYDLDVTVEDDTYWTPGGTDCELTRWEVKPEALEGYSEECQELIKLAAGYEVECNHTPYDFLDESVSKITLTQTQLRNLIKESIVNVINEYAYHEKQTKETPEEHEAFIKKKAAAKKRYYDSQKKEKKDGATDYYDYKHGDHPAINEISSNLYNRAADKAFKDMMQNYNHYPTKNKRERQWKNFIDQARIRGDEEKNSVCPSVDERDLPNMPAGTYVVMDGDGRDAISANFRTRYSGHAGTKEQCEEYVDRFYDKSANWEYLPEIVPLEQYLKNKR